MATAETDRAAMQDILHQRHRALHNGLQRLVNDMKTLRTLDEDLGFEAPTGDVVYTHDMRMENCKVARMAAWLRLEINSVEEMLGLREETK